MRYRTGRKNPCTIYRQLGDEPSDDDRFVGSCCTDFLASELVTAANAGQLAWAGGLVDQPER